MILLQNKVGKGERRGMPGIIQISWLWNTFVYHLSFFNLTWEFLPNWSSVDTVFFLGSCAAWKLIKFSNMYGYVSTTILNSMLQNLQHMQNILFYPVLWKKVVYFLPGQVFHSKILHPLPENQPLIPIN